MYKPKEIVLQKHGSEGSGPTKYVCGYTKYGTRNFKIQNVFVISSNIYLFIYYV